MFTLQLLGRLVIISKYKYEMFLLLYVDISRYWRQCGSNNNDKLCQVGLPLKYSHSPHIYSVLTAENVCILEKTYFKLEAHISQRLLPHCDTQ